MESLKLDIQNFFQTVIAEYPEQMLFKPDHKFHDRTTGQHMLDVASAGSAISMEINNPIGASAVLLATLVHDIGKLKALKETGKMFNHEKIGAEMIRNMPRISITPYTEEEQKVLNLVAELVLGHGYRMNALQVAAAKARKYMEERALAGGVDVAEFFFLLEQVMLADKFGFSSEGQAQADTEIAELKKKVLDS